LERLQKATGLDNFIRDIWPDIKTEQDLRDKLIEILHDQFDDLMHTCTTAWLVDADEALAIDDRITKPAQDFITSWSQDLADIMHLTTNTQIENILLRSQSQALSIEETARKISDSAIRSPGSRARRVAITEVLRVESYSQLEAMRQNPAVDEKEWHHTGLHKNKPRPNHQAISGQRKKVDEPFDLIGADGGRYSPMSPRDTSLPAGESINCHCIMKSIRNSSVTGMTADERRELRRQYMDEVDAEWDAEHMASESDGVFKNDWSKTTARMVTKEEKNEIISYAADKGVRIVDLSKFDGDPGLIKSQIDTISVLRETYTNIPPRGITVTVKLLEDQDFAELQNNTIVFNSLALRDKAITEKNLLNGNKFASSKFESISVHEFGHMISRKTGNLRVKY
ncbi:MAG: hypothetical protein HUJ76_12895, partial [Parasporobacterium sp.]|nr:hypothetical protein [Parasporobacterium sp.]